MSDMMCDTDEPHGAHSHAGISGYGLEWCPGRGPQPKQDEGLLLARLGAAEVANQHARPCQVCDALRKMSEPARRGVESALAGTIGERTLAQILTDSGYPTGRRAVQNHKREAHTP